jgi:hypothetical protein
MTGRFYSTVITFFRHETNGTGFSFQGLEMSRRTQISVQVEASSALLNNIRDLIEQGHTQLTNWHIGQRIYAKVLRQLAWSHFLKFIYLKDLFARDFYTHMCAHKCWNVRRLCECKNVAGKLQWGGYLISVPLIAIADHFLERI